jgi:hypothetical protein
MGEHEEAHVQLQKSLDVLIAVYGRDLDVYIMYENVAAVYERQGNHQEATAVASKAYHWFLNVLGPDHPHTKRLKSSLGL